MFNMEVLAISIASLDTFNTRYKIITSDELLKPSFRFRMLYLQGSFLAAFLYPNLHYSGCVPIVLDAFLSMLRICQHSSKNMDGNEENPGVNLSMLE